MIQGETADLERRNAKRRSKISVNFVTVEGVGPCADGWFFRVHESFRDALDIAYTIRKKEALWTEGDQPIYGFRRHDQLSTWAEGERYVAHVTQAEPDRISRTEEGLAVVRGTVWFNLFERTNGEYAAIGWHSCSQPEFAEFLRSGTIPRLGVDLPSALMPIALKTEQQMPLF